MEYLPRTWRSLIQNRPVISSTTISVSFFFTSFHSLFTSVAVLEESFDRLKFPMLNELASIGRRQKKIQAKDNLNILTSGRREKKKTTKFFISYNVIVCEIWKHWAETKRHITNIIANLNASVKLEFSLTVSQANFIEAYQSHVKGQTQIRETSSTYFHSGEWTPLFLGWRKRCSIEKKEPAFQTISARSAAVQILLLLRWKTWNDTSQNRVM